MKPLGYLELKNFARSADGPFGFFDLWKPNKSILVWSDEDFDWILFNTRQDIK